MKNLNRGFTLIELVVVIVLLGILSAVAIPKYIDYKSAAGIAAAKGVAAALSAASETNYAAYLIGSTAYVKGASCATAMSLLNASPGSNYSASTNAVAATAASTAASTASTTAANDLSASNAIGLSLTDKATADAKAAASAAASIQAAAASAAAANNCTLTGPETSISTAFTIIPTP